MKLAPRFHDRRIIACLAEGLCNKDISKRLDLPDRSLKWRLHKIFTRNGLSYKSDQRRFIVMAVNKTLR
jgi:DNA-binding NarL/FixJ family response regulator